MTDKTALKSGVALSQNDQNFKRLCATIDEIDIRRAVVRLEITKEHTSGHGFCHGGDIFTLADATFGFAANSYNIKLVAQTCTITYICPVMENDVLIAEAIQLKKFGRSGIYDVFVKSQKSDLVAIFRGHSRDIGGSLYA